MADDGQVGAGDGRRGGRGAPGRAEGGDADGVGALVLVLHLDGGAGEDDQRRRQAVAQGDAGRGRRGGRRGAVEEDEGAGDAVQGADPRGRRLRGVARGVARRGARGGRRGRPGDRDLDRADGGAGTAAAAGVVGRGRRTGGGRVGGGDALARARVAGVVAGRRAPPGAAGREGEHQRRHEGPAAGHAHDATCRATRRPSAMQSLTAMPW